MTPREQVEMACAKLNTALIELLEQDTRLPLTVSSRLSYVSTVDPVGMGFNDEYMRGEFDDILSTYFDGINQKFHDKRVALGLQPPMPLEDFMGEEFMMPPKPFKEELETYIKAESVQLERLAENRQNIPDEIVSDIQAKRQDKLAILIKSLQTGHYCVTPEEFEYAKRYHDKEQEYFDMFKD